MAQYQAVKGMNDLFENELATWRHVEKTVRDVMSFYGFGEIRTPILEDINVFARGVGEGTDIVEKEMYVLHDRDGKDLCLRPENTASVIRALIENGQLGPDAEVKNYYIGPMFRRERPQKGRLRQFHQFGAEHLGVDSPKCDVEMIALVYQIFTELGLNRLNLVINSLGQKEDRKQYIAALIHYYNSVQEQLCGDCQRRLLTNPLRLLDCKQPGCGLLKQKAPRTIDYLEEKSKQHFVSVQQGLSKLNIDFVVDTNLVRGIDYYTDTVFELIASSEGLGSQNTVAAGGRYDGLVQLLGGAQTPGIGFASGIERVFLLLENEKLLQPHPSLDVALIYADDVGQKLCEDLVIELRRQHVAADMDLKGRSVKAQFRRADRLKAKSVIVIGQNEVGEQRASLKWLEKGEMQEVALQAQSIVKLLKR